MVNRIYYGTHPYTGLLKSSGTNNSAIRASSYPLVKKVAGRQYKAAKDALTMYYNFNPSDLLTGKGMVLWQSYHSPVNDDVQYGDSECIAAELSFLGH